MAATYSEEKSTPLEDESAVMAVAKEMAGLLWIRWWTWPPSLEKSAR
jgi:hypothetical protein